MKLSQQKKEEDQENYNSQNWDYCCYTNRFKKTFSFEAMLSKSASQFAIFLAKIDSEEYKIYSDVKKNKRNVYVQIISELEDEQINKILSCVDAAYDKVKNYG